MPNNDEADRKQSDLKGLSFAYRISSELVAALIVSVILGLTIDKFLDTKPIALITLIILGFFAGLLNIYRLIRRIENSK
ncbi:AtpZ/AtpI family protein [Alphaproteobacteria bacterium]|jgi:ATP synthase protein I|nr:AtpZ/AtpI family protein [Alphaproteobacteria bacterium]MDA8711153.1 AtpZ/AtpI family protein [Alphaproteobacteria bacterium]MDB0032411.1 AtpZ/AtpI family protein [Alphaproteobacteria bacterium]MDB0034639.1 AtpZ/AtpI family protein [Alphaproteobacteria bacterium]|tara:strand:+ start:865 stop:1101 length:237 start_codon:yes stop_codon:yes gene_type:complete